MALSSRLISAIKRTSALFAFMPVMFCTSYPMSVEFTIFGVKEQRTAGSFNACAAAAAHYLLHAVLTAGDKSAVVISR